MKKIHYDSYRPDEFVFYGKCKDDFFIGVELEVNTTTDNCENGMLNDFLSNVNQDEDFIYFKEDCTVYNGVEIVSHPATIKFHENCFEWKNIFNNIKKYKITYGNGCGLHFHLSKTFFDSDNIKTIDFFINNYNKIANFVTFIGGRDFSSYSNRRMKNISEWGRVDVDHFSAFHVTNSTIELRFCNTTSHMATFFKRMELIYCIAHFCKRHSFSEITSNSAEKIYNMFKEFVIDFKMKYLKKEDFDKYEMQ